MRGRQRSPPFIGESHFFTVVNPYPDQPHESRDYPRAFSRWVACIIGENNLLAFYYKPKSPNVVIIEVIQNGFEVRRLLGAHRWKEILREPRKEDKGQSSCVFPCALSTAWSLEKIRWHREDVKSSWFKDWSPAKDGAITHPYPMSHYCEPPPENVLRASLCRAIREDIFRLDKQEIFTPVPRLATSSLTVGRLRSAVLHSSDSSEASTDELETPAEGQMTTSRVPAIRESEDLRSDDPAAAAADTGHTSLGSLWLVSGNESEAEEALCEAHGTLCTKGICRLCAQRKRAEQLQERPRRRQDVMEKSQSEQCGKPELIGRDVHAPTRKRNIGKDLQRTTAEFVHALPAHLRAGAPAGETESYPSKERLPTQCGPTAASPTMRLRPLIAAVNSASYDTNTTYGESTAPTVPQQNAMQLHGVHTTSRYRWADLVEDMLNKLSEPIWPGVDFDDHVSVVSEVDPGAEPF